LTFKPLFTEPIDLDPEDLLFTKDLSTWPSWLSFYPEQGRIVGIANQSMGTQTIVIRGTDEFGLFAELTINIFVRNEFPLTYNGQDVIELRSN